MEQERLEREWARTHGPEVGWLLATELRRCGRSLEAVRIRIELGDDQLRHGPYRSDPAKLLKHLRTDKPIVHASTGVVLRWCGDPPRQWWRLWMADCAEHVLHVWLARYPDDARPAEAIAAARRYARGGLGETELAEAAWAAYAAARTVSEAARLNVPLIPGIHSAVVEKEAWEAAQVAAAASDAAWVEAWWAKASSVVTAARAATDQAAERDWQADRLVEWLTGTRT